MVRDLAQASQRARSPGTEIGARSPAGSARPGLSPGLDSDRLALFAPSTRWAFFVKREESNRDMSVNCARVRFSC